MGAPTTAWTRIEPATDDGSMETSLQARVHDPLWLLARQWQLGEFTGADGGEPMRASLALEVAPLATVAGAPYDAARTGLDTVLEREPAPPSLRARVEAGLHFVRLLERAGLGGYRTAYAAAYRIEPDSATDATYGAVVTGRVPDGIKVRKALTDTAAGGPHPLEPAVAPGDDEDVMREVATAFVRWATELVDEPPPEAAVTWRHDRMEYAAEVGAELAGGPLILRVPEHTGRLDWSSFVVSASAASTDAVSHPLRHVEVLPGPVTYPGAPAPRYWEIEDARMAFAAVDADPDDLARMLLVELAVVYGDDWYTIPVELPAGTVTRVHSLVVVDSFGQTTAVPAASALDPEWRMFALSPDPTVGAAGAGLDVLLLPPVAPGRLEGAPLETVLLLRDEIANMGWAVEQTIEGADGRSFDRRATRRDAAPAGDHALSAYRLATAVPEHWIPLVPHTTADGGMALRRGVMPRHAPDGTLLPPAEPLGELLRASADGDLVLRDDEVPREGANVRRGWRLARSDDGATHLWLARSKVPGRGEGSSGLRFDVLDEPSAGTDP